MRYTPSLAVGWMEIDLWEREGKSGCGWERWGKTRR
jgi:hypothetical protein